MASSLLLLSFLSLSLPSLSHIFIPSCSQACCNTPNLNISTDPSASSQPGHICARPIVMSTSLKIVESLYEYRWYVVAVLTAWYLLRTWQSYSRLSHIKGPWLAHLSDFWLLKALYGQQTHHLLYAVDKTYGMYSHKLDEADC